MSASLHLQRELARRHQDQRARSTRPRPIGPREQTFDHRQTKRGRLTGARLGAHQQIGPAQDDGNRLRLNRRRLAITQSGERKAESGRRARVSKTALRGSKLA